MSQGAGRKSGRSVTAQSTTIQGADPARRKAHSRTPRQREDEISGNRSHRPCMEDLGGWHAGCVTGSTPAAAQTKLQKKDYGQEREKGARDRRSHDGRDILPVRPCNLHIGLTPDICVFLLLSAAPRPPRKIRVGERLIDWTKGGASPPAAPIMDFFSWYFFVPPRVRRYAADGTPCRTLGYHIRIFYAFVWGKGVPEGGTAGRQVREDMPPG